MTLSHEPVPRATVPQVTTTVQTERKRVVDIMDEADSRLYPALLAVLTAKALHPTSRYAALSDDDLHAHVGWGDLDARRVQRFREEQARASA